MALGIRLLVIVGLMFCLLFLIVGLLMIIVHFSKGSKNKVPYEAWQQVPPLNQGVYCKSCGCVNDSDYSFCKSCGKPR